jgi:TolB-like protein
VVTKDAIFAAAWPGTVVEENTLQVHMSALRKALGSDYVSTVHGRGYKYVGPLPVASSLQAEGTVPANRKPVIAVLPFDNLSGDPEQQYFSDGFTVDITDRLTAFRAFAVIGHYSAAAFRGAAADLQVIRERLRADFVVTGSVRRAAGRLRIAVRILDPISGEAIWADRYDRPISDLFDLQDEISQLVAAKLKRHLEVEINVRNTRKAHASLSSYENMLQGYWHFKKLTRAGNLAARACFERAVTLDPGNAEAMGWLSVTYSEQWVQDFTAEHAQRGVEISAQAVALDPTNAIIHAIRAWILMCTGDRAGSLEASERGMSLNPGDPSVQVNRALALTYAGQFDEAHALFDQARRLEPLPPLWFGEFAGILAFAEGRYADTLAGVEPIAECAWDVMYALACYGHMGEPGKAAAALARLPDGGRNIDFHRGIAQEQFCDAEVRERLIEGVRKSLER